MSIQHVPVCFFVTYIICLCRRIAVMLLFFSPVTSLHRITSNNDFVKTAITNILNHCDLNFYKVKCPSCCHCLRELWTVWYAFLMCYRTRILSGLRRQYLTKFWNFPFVRIFYVTQTAKHLMWSDCIFSACHTD